MTDLRLSHLYRETNHWTDSVGWWSNLGFTFADQWGEEPHRAGRLQKGATVVVLSEVGSRDEITDSVFLVTENLAQIARQTGSDVVETHWGAPLVTVTDPDGRTYNFEFEDGNT
jgi:hypothetical protein